MGRERLVGWMEVLVGLVGGTGHTPVQCSTTQHGQHSWCQQFVQCDEDSNSASAIGVLEGCTAGWLEVGSWNDGIWDCESSTTYHRGVRLWLFRCMQGTRDMTTVRTVLSHTVSRLRWAYARRQFISLSPVLSFRSSFNTSIVSPRSYPIEMPFHSLW